MGSYGDESTAGLKFSVQQLNIKAAPKGYSYYRGASATVLLVATYCLAFITYIFFADGLTYLYFNSMNKAKKACQNISAPPSRSFTLIHNDEELLLIVSMMHDAHPAAPCNVHLYARRVDPELAVTPPKYPNQIHENSTYYYICLNVGSVKAIISGRINRPKSIVLQSIELQQYWPILSYTINI